MVDAGFLVVLALILLARWGRARRRQSPCANVEAFVDGELDYLQAVAFTDHLAECRRCQGSVTGLMQLEVLGSRYLDEQRYRKKWGGG